MKIKVALLGGGSFVVRACEWLGVQDFVAQVVVITAPRHAEEIVENSSGHTAKFVDQVSSVAGSIDKVALLVVDSIDDSRSVQVLSDSDIAFSFGAAWIFKEKHIDLCSNFLNMHCTTLPQWRGGGGFSWQILAGENRSAVTFHRVDAGVDTGDIVFTNSFYFPDGVATPKQRSEYLEKFAWATFRELVSDFASNGSIPASRAQDECFSSYFPRLNSSVQACIDWRWSSSEIVRFITAFDDPYPGAFSFVAGSDAKFFLKKSLVLRGESSFHTFQAGIVYRSNHSGLHICARNGAVLVEEVFDESGCSALDRLKVGDRLFTTQADIDKAMSARFVYTPKGLKE